MYRLASRDSSLTVSDFSSVNPRTISTFVQRDRKASSVDIGLVPAVISVITDIESGVSRENQLSAGSSGRLMPSLRILVLDKDRCQLFARIVSGLFSRA